MYKLYWSPGSANMAPHAVLEEIGAPHELVRIDLDKNEHKSAAYLGINPHARVPTLIDDGKAIYESAAILLYLCERHPQAGLMPAVGAADRGHFLQWLIYLTNTVQEELMHWWHADNYLDSEPARAELKRVVERRLAGMWQHVDGVLAGNGPYLLGKQFSSVDIYLVMLCRWSRSMARPATDYANLMRCIALVSGRPAWRRMMQAEEIDWPGVVAA